MAGALDIARQELARYTGQANRRVLVATLVLGLVVGTAWPAVQERGVSPDEGLYSVDVHEGSALAPVVDSDPAFAVVGEDTRAPPDLVLAGTEVHWDPDSDKSQAAADRLASTARTYMDRVMLDEEDQDAAFPVRVTLIFEARDLSRTPAEAPAGNDTPPEPDGGTDDQTDNQTDGGSGPDEPAPAPGPGEGNATGETASVTPAEITPPFPMKSLLYTFAYLIPLTFVGELFGGSVFAERVKGRGRVLLAAPLSRLQLVAGKSLPYVGATVLLSAIISAVLGAGLMGFLASLPIIAFALASALLVGTLAPSQRALTFLLVSANVLLSTFLFLPALFTEVPPVAFLSPVGLIAAAIRGDPITIGQLLYGTVPLAVIAGTFVLLSMATFRDEILFAPGQGPAKLVDGLAHLVDSRPRLVLAGILAVPLALAVELFVLVFAVTMSLQAAFVAFLVGGAAVEEALKALPVYARSARGGAPSIAPWVLGGLVGLGFFLGEKGMAALTLFGFDVLPRADEALATFGVGTTPLILLAPLALHAATTTLFAFAVDRDRSWALAGWLAATALHAAYNLTVIVTLGGLSP